MSQYAFLTLKAILSITIGAGLIIVPSPLLSFFGVPLDASGSLAARLLGVDMMGIGLVCWVIKKSGTDEIADIILVLFIADTIGAIILIIAQLNGIMNILGWINVATWIFLTMGLGYFRFLTNRLINKTNR
jgi:hypothetical protein